MSAIVCEGGFWGTREVEDKYGRMQKGKGIVAPFSSLFFFVKKHTQRIKYDR